MNRQSPRPAAAAPDLPTLRKVEIEDHARSELRGLKIGYREAGRPDSPVLFCMHGIGSNSSGYRRQLGDLADRYRVIAWDAPGYGESDNLPQARPRDVDYADALLGTLDALGIDRVHLVGSSFGAIVAAAFAARYPERVRCLVLSAPAPGFARLPEAERKELFQKRVDDMERLGPAELARQRAPFLVAPDAPPAVIEAATALVAATPPKGYAQAAAVLDNADTVANAARIDAPTLVLVGTEDKITPRDSCAGPIHAALRDGALEIFEGIGHLLKLEAPDRFNALIADFIERHPER